MLVVTRGPGQTLLLTLPDGKTIELAILSVRGRRVKVGVDAPTDITIERRELGPKPENVR